MYRILLALALGYAIKENISKLLSVEGGIRSFEAVHWVLVALSVIMIPLCVYCFINGWKEYNENQKQKKEEAEERENELTNEKFGELLEDAAEEGESDGEDTEETTGSKYDI